MYYDSLARALVAGGHCPRGTRVGVRAVARTAGGDAAVAQLKRDSEWTRWERGVKDGCVCPGNAESSVSWRAAVWHLAGMVDQWTRE